MNKELINIIKLSRLLVIKYNERISIIARKHNISFQEADMLLIFSNNPNIINAKDVVNISKVSKAYVSKSLNLLVNKNLISIIPDKIDKRKQKIIINNSANKIIEELKEEEKKYINLITKNIKSNDLNKYIEVYKLMCNNIIDRKEDKYD